MSQVSVLMSVYNDAPFLREAINSILNQSFSDFEFVIVNDGSTDETSQILDGYTDPRIVCLNNPENIGLTRSLNRGLEVCRGDFIARMDANDVAVPDRLAHQVEYLHSQPKLGLVSGDMASMDMDGNPLPEEKSPYGIPASHDYLTWALLWNNPIAHITVMMRRAVLAEHNITYVPEFNRAEDYELWGTLSRYTQLIRLPKVYAYRRVVPTGVSFTNRETQLATMYRVAEREAQVLVGEAIPASGVKTAFYSIHGEQDVTNHPADIDDFYGAANYVVMAYRLFREKHLSDEDQRRIKGDAVGHLLRLSRKGGGLYPLWKLRKVSKREFFSRVNLRHIRQTLR